MKRPTLFFFISGILHLFAVIFAMAPWQKHHEEPDPLPIAVTYLASAAVKGRSTKNSGPSNKDSVKSSQKSILRFSSGPDFSKDLNGQNGASQEFEGKGGQPGHGWSEEDFGYGGLKFENVEDNLMIRSLAEQADALLFFPGPLANRTLSGGVNVKLYFKKTGGCDQEKMRIDSGSKYFRVYILALLKKLCSYPQIERLKFSRIDRIDMNFVFSVVDQSKYNSHPPVFVSGNTALLERHVVKVPGEVKLGPIRLYGPYIAVDFPYLFEKWDQLTTGRDPLEDFR